MSLINPKLIQNSKVAILCQGFSLGKLPAAFKQLQDNCAFTYI